MASTAAAATAVGGGGGGSGSGGEGSNAINTFSSYFITIDGISTVFSSPVRLASTSTGQSQGHQEGGLPSVQVITGDILAPETKVTYDPGEDTKLPHDPFPQVKSRLGHHTLYGTAPSTKGLREYSASELQHATVLLEPGAVTPGTLDGTMQGHTMPTKPKVE